MKLSCKFSNSHAIGSTPHHLCRFLLTRRLTDRPAPRPAPTTNPWPGLNSSSGHHLPIPPVRALPALPGNCHPSPCCPTSPLTALHRPEPGRGTCPPLTTVFRL